MTTDDLKPLPHISVTVEEKQLFKGATDILKHIRPLWNEENISFKMFTDGITNKLVACSSPSDPGDVVLVRVYGEKTDLLIDRKAETRNLRVMHSAGYAPQLYATFANGLAYEYVPGEILSVESCRSLEVYPLVAAMMARMHCLSCGVTGDQTTPREAMLWTKTRRFIQLAPTRFSDPKKQAKFLELIPCKAELEREFTELEGHLKTLDSPLVFSHNDLLLANVIHDKARETVTFIDYEYADYNYQAFDIGNHFNEFAGVTNVDYSLYPPPDFQQAWIRVYLREYHNARGLTKEPSEEEVGKMYALVNKFALSSHFLWAMWGLVQAEHSTIDFDYLGYASIRLNEYFAKKEHFLSLDHCTSAS